MIKNDVVTGNDSGAAGGGVAGFGRTMITGSTFSFNVADELAGAVAGGAVDGGEVHHRRGLPPKMIGGLAASQGLTLIYSTVEENSSTDIDVQPVADCVGLRGGRAARARVRRNIVGGTRSLGHNFETTAHAASAAARATRPRRRSEAAAGRGTRRVR